LEALSSRLKRRGTESEDAIGKRLAAALAEINYATDGAHDLVIVNDEIDRAYGLLKQVALGEDIASDPLPNFENSSS